MNVDKALETVGGYRRWHIAVFIWLTFSSFLPICQHGLNIVFIGWTPPYHCNVPLDVPLNQSLPYNGDSLSKCEMFVNSSVDNTTTECTNGVHYYNDGYETIVTEFDLVCQNDFLTDLSQMIFACLQSVADIFCSYFTDRFGRKNIHIIGHVVLGVLGSCVSFSPNYVCFVTLRALTGMVARVIVNSGITLLTEFFGAKHRTVILMGMELLWVVPYLVPALTSYLLKDWRINQLVASLLSFIWVFYICFLSESVPWLVANKQYHEAEANLQSLARRNQIKVGKNLLNKPDEATIQYNHTIKDDEIVGNADERRALNTQDDIQFADADKLPLKANHVPLSDLFCDPKLRFHLLMCNIFWLSNTLVYSGLTLVSPSLGPDRFFNYTLMGIVEIPACVACIFVVKRYGRKIPQMVMFMLTGVALGAAAFVPNRTDLKPLVLCLALVGKFGITASFAIMVLYARELFPTTLRSSSTAWSSVGGTVGSFIAPLASYLVRHLFWLPNAIFALSAIIAGIATLTLPETMNKPLPLTTEDIYRTYYNREPSNKKPDKKHQKE